MSLFLFTIPPTSLSPFLSTSCSSLPMAVNPTPVSRLLFKSIDVYPKSCKGIGLLRKRGAIIANASSDGAEPPTESKDEVGVVAVDKLPLESKLKERMEQKMKMKLAKKVRLRRKRLVRKRRLRKKGRWPPSKMKKLKNV